jgi:hypothetical protein
MVFGVVKNVVESVTSPDSLLNLGMNFAMPGGFLAGPLAQNALKSILNGENPLNPGNLFGDLAKEALSSSIPGTNVLGSLFGGRSDDLLGNVPFNPLEILNGFDPQELLPSGKLAEGMMQTPKGAALLSELFKGQDNGTLEQVAEKMGLPLPVLEQILVKTKFDKALADA